MHALCSSLVMTLCACAQAGTHALLRKQLESVGCPLWMEPPDPDAPATPLPLAGEADAIVHVKLWLYCCDMGPDQVMFRKLVTTFVYNAGQLQELVIFLHCLFHQEELVVKTGLGIIDAWLKEVGCTWKYYAVLAKLIHIWREKAFQVFSVWQRVYTALWAVACAKTLPPKCIAGRWGSVSETERRLINNSKAPESEPCKCLSQLVHVMRVVLGGPPVDSDAPAPIQDDPDRACFTDSVIRCVRENLEDPRLEEQQAHRQRASRWGRDLVGPPGLGALGNMWFVPVVRIAKHCRDPLDKFRAFMHTRLSEQEVDSGGGHVARLVRGKSIEYVSALCTLLDDPGWLLKILEDHSPPCDRSELVTLAVTLTCHHAVGFHRRIVAVTKQSLP